MQTQNKTKRRKLKPWLLPAAFLLLIILSWLLVLRHWQPLLIMALATLIALIFLILWAHLILKQEQANQALEDTQDFYQSLVNTFPRRIYRKDKHNRFLFGNQAFLAELDRPLTGITGKTDFDLFPPGLAAKHQQQDAEVLLSGQLQETIEEHTLPDGQKRYLQVTKSPVFNTRKEIIGVQCISWDITHSRHAELEREQLLQAEREQRLLAETLGEVFLALTAQTSYEALLDEILRQIRRIITCSAANIMLLQGDLMKIVRWHGYEELQPENLIAHLEQPLAEFPIDAHIVHTRQGLVIPDVQQDPAWITTPVSPWIKSFLAVPLCLQDRVLGILRLDSNRPYNFSSKDLSSLQPLANAAAIALENARLYRQAQQEIAIRKQAEFELIQRNAELLALLYAGATISTSLDLHVVLETITREMANLLSVEQCAIFEWTRPEDTISMIAGFGLEEDRLTYNLADIPLARQVLTERYAQQLTLSQPDLTPGDSRYMRHQAAKTLLFLPMEYQNRLVGLIQLLDRRAERTFAYVELALAQLLANQAATAIENAKLYDLAQQQLAERIKAEEELRRLSARNQAILDALPDTLLILNHDGHILADKHHPGLTLPPGATGLVLHHIDRLRHTGQMQTFEHHHPPAQYFEIRLVSSSHDEILAIIRDITRRKHAQQALQESEAKFRTLTETTAAAIFIYQGDQNRYVNASAEIVTGYTRDELLTMTFWDIIHPDFRDLVIARGLARQRQESVPPRYELKILTKHGAERWLDVTLGLIQFEGSPAVLGTAFDITDRKTITEALKKSETDLKTIFDNSLQAFILIDLDATVRAFNRTAAEGISLLLGKELQAGAPVYDFVPDPEKEELTHSLARALRGEAVILEKKLTINNQEKWFEYRYNPVLTDDGRVAGVCFSAIDIDERKRAADTLAASEARLLAEMQSVLTITRALVSETQPTNLLNLITNQANQLMKTDGAAVLLLSEDGQRLELTAFNSAGLDPGPDLSLPLRGSLAELALITHTVQTTDQRLNDDYITAIRKLLTPTPIYALLCAPLEIQGQTLGVLLLWNQQTRAFTHRDTYLIYFFADQAALALYNARLHLENRRLAIEQERERLARELHDSVTQSLYSIGMAAQASLRLLDQDLPARLPDPLKYIHQLSQTALAEMRERVYDLHPTVLKDRNLVETLQGYCDMLSQQYGLTIDFTADKDLPLSIYQRENLYYIAREALWNVVKHAGPTRVQVRLTRNAAQIELSIADQGPGFALSPAQRGEMMGLRSMEERARLLMGAFELHTQPETGTRITVKIPARLPQLDQS